MTQQTRIVEIPITDKNASLFMMLFKAQLIKFNELPDCALLHMVSSDFQSFEYAFKHESQSVQLAMLERVIKYASPGKWFSNNTFCMRISTLADTVQQPEMVGDIIEWLYNDHSKEFKWASSCWYHKYISKELSNKILNETLRTFLPQSRLDLVDKLYRNGFIGDGYRAVLSVEDIDGMFTTEEAIKAISKRTLSQYTDSHTKDRLYCDGKLKTVIWSYIITAI